jgi:hypothetical protein
MQIALEATKSIPIVGNGTDWSGRASCSRWPSPGATRLG